MKKSLQIFLVLIFCRSLFAENSIWGDKLLNGFRESETTSIEHPARYAFDENFETYWQLCDGETSGFIEFYQEEVESFSGCQIDYYAEENTEISFYYEKEGTWLDIKYGKITGKNDGIKSVIFSDDLYDTNRILLYVNGNDASICKIREVKFLKRDDKTNYQKILPEKYTFNEKEYITIKADRLWNGLIKNEWYEPLWYLPWEIQNGPAGTENVFPPYYGHPSSNGEIIWYLDGEYTIDIVKAYFLFSGRSIAFEFWNGKEWIGKKEFRYAWQTGWNRIDINSGIKTSKIRITFPDGWEASRFISQIEFWGEGERLNRKTGSVYCDENNLFGKTYDNYKDDGRIWLSEKYNDGNLLIDENEIAEKSKAFTFDRMYQLEKVRIWCDCSNDLYIFINDEWNPISELIQKNDYFEADLKGTDARKIRFESNSDFSIGEIKLYGSPLEDKNVQNEVWWPNENCEVYKNNNDCIIGWTGDALTQVTLDGQYNPSRLDNIFWMPLYRCGGVNKDNRIMQAEFSLDGKKSHNSFIVNTKGGNHYIKQTTFIGNELITIDLPAGDIWTQNKYIILSGKYGNCEDIEITVNGQPVECIDGIYTSTIILNEGENYLNVVAKSNDNRSQTKTVKVICDTIAPTFEVFNPLEGEYIAHSDILISLDGREDKQLWWKINGEEWEYEPNYIMNKIYTLEDNFYTYYFTSCDRSGNISETQSVNFCVDVTPPKDFIIYDNIDRQKYEWTNNTTPIISFETNDVMSGIDHYECQIDNGEWVTVTSPYKLPELEDGIHKICVKAFDKAGNTTLGTESYGDFNNQFHYIKVDTVAPNKVLGLKAVTGRDDNGTHIIVNWTGDYDDDNYQDYIISRNPSFSKNEYYITDRKDGSKEYFDIENLTDGKAYTYYIKAVDRAGNIGEVVDFTTTAGFAVSKIENGKNTFVEYENMSIDIPDGAFAEDIVEILINEVLPEQYGIESRNPLVSKIYSINQKRRKKQGDGTIKEEITSHAELREDALITINYKKSSIPEGYVDGDLKAFYYDDIFGRWVMMDSVMLDTSANTLTFETNHFTDFSIQATKEMQLTPQEIKNSDYNPFATGIGQGEINVSEESGDVSTQFTEMILPGRNGLDLVIQRIYSTSTARKDAKDIKTKNNTPSKENVEKEMEGDIIWKIGDGWRLNFPSLSWNANELWIRDLNGQSVTVSHMETVSDDTDSFTFKDKLKYWHNNTPIDRIIRMENHEYNDAIIEIYLQEVKKGWWIFSSQSYKYTGAILYQKDGKKLKFDDNGRIFEIFDNTEKNFITFDYSDLNKIKITDSHKREIFIERKDDNISSILTGNRKVVYSLIEDSYKDQNGEENKRIKLQSAIDIGNREWNYSYESIGLSSKTNVKNNYNISNSETKSYILALSKVSGIGFGEKSIEYKTGVYSYNENAYGITYEIVNDYIYASLLSEKMLGSDTNVLVNENYSFTFETNEEAKQNYVKNCIKNDGKVIIETLYKKNIKDRKRISDAPEAIKDVISYEECVGQSNDGKTVVTTIDSISKTLIIDNNRIPFETEKRTYNEKFLRPTEILISRKDKTCTKTSNSYDNKGNIIQVILTSSVEGNAENIPYNKTVSSTIIYTYDEISTKPGMYVVTQKTSVEDSGTINVYYKYDTQSGNMVYKSYVSFDEKLNKWSYDYNEDYGELAKETTPENVITSYTYIYPEKENYKIIKTIGTYSSSKEYDFATGNLYKDIDYDEYDTTYSYDNLNRIILQRKSVKDGELYDLNDNPLREVTILIHYNDVINNIYSEITNEKGIITHNDYDNLGRLIKSIQDFNEQKKTTELVYDNYGRPIVMYGPYLQNSELKETFVTCYKYDALDRIVSITRPNNSKSITYEYKDEERKILTTDESKRKFITITDWNDNNIFEGKIHNGSFIGIINTYDSENRLISSIDGNGKETKINYNSKGLETSRENDDFITKKEYDDDGRCTKKIMGEDPNELITEYTYNDLGFINNSTINVKVNSKDKVILTSYEYDGRGNKKKEVSGYKDEINTIKPLEDKTIYKHEKSWTYDFRGNIISETDEEGYTTKYSYDECGNRIKLIDPRENTEKYDSSFFIQMEYDNLNRLEKAWIPKSGEKTIVSHDNPDISFTYDGRGNVKEREDSNGLTTTYAYNSRGLLESETKSGSDKTLKTSYTYDDSDLQLTVTEPSGLVTTNTYDDMGRLIIVKKDTLQTVSYEYDGNGNITIETDGNGNKLIRTYNANNQILTESIDNVYTMVNEYYKNGLLSTTTDGTNNVRTNVYDNSGRLISETSNNGTVSFEYDAWGNIIKTTDLNGTVFERTYTEKNQLKTETATNNKKTENLSFVYDEAGCIKSVTNDFETIYNNLISGIYQSDPYGNIRGMKWNEMKFETLYTYDSMNRLTSFTNADGKKQSYEYNTLGQLVSSCGIVNETMSWLENGLLNSVAVKKDESIVLSNMYKYDNLNRLISYNYTKQNEVSPFNGCTYSYDNVSNITTRKFLGDSSESSYSYDAYNQLVKANEYGMFEKKLDYSLEENATKYGEVFDDYEGDSYPTSSLTKVDYQASEIKFDCGAKSVIYDFNVNVSISKFDLVTNTYTKNNRVTDKNLRLFAGSISENEVVWKEIDKTLYKYEKNPENGSLSFNFKEPFETRYLKVNTTWNDRDLYWQAIDSNVEFKNIPTEFLRVWMFNRAQFEEYKYDKAGNRTKLNSTEITYYKNSAGGNTNLRKFDGEWYYTYDKNGNRSKKGKSITAEGASYVKPTASTDGKPEENVIIDETAEYWEYTWDLHNRLIEVKQYNAPDELKPVNVKYKYDGLNYRIQRIGTDGIETNYAYGRNGALVYESNTISKGMITSRSYVYINEKIIGFVDKDISNNEKPYYTLTDIQGSITEVLDETLTTVWKSGYDAFGEVAGVEKTTFEISFNGFYTGKDIDPETGLTYHWNRWRSEDGSIWLTQDPARDGGNWWNYCNSNPINLIDPTGLFDWNTNTIQEGDTLAKIAQEYNQRNGSFITYEAIANVNGISDPNHIEIGNNLSFEGLSYNDISPKGYNPDTFDNQNIKVQKNFVENKIDTTYIQNSTISNDKLNSIETIVNTGGTLSFIGGKLASNVANLSVVSENLFAISDKLGYLSFGIDLYQFFESPSLQNSRNLMVTSIGLKEPVLGIFLSLYFSYQDAVDNIFNTKPKILSGSGIIDASSLGRGSLW